MTNQPLKTIVIAGGGTAGWMTAALLSKLLFGYEIILIESEEIGTIGVGEATIPGIKIYNQLLGIDENDMVRATQGSFKLAIEFVNWRERGHTYMHGFGKIGQDMMWLHTHHFWLKGQANGWVRHFDHYALNCLMSRKNRFARPDHRTPLSPLADVDYAFHFDASLYAAYLRRMSEPRGVKRIEGRIVSVHQRPEDGFVDHLVMESGQQVAGDLFIDCSGMRSLLLGQTLGVGFEDWSHWLLNDRALAVPCDHPATPDGLPDITPYTRSTAHGSGWQWRIPLQHRVGNGHVYSSQHISDDQAASVLMANLDGKPLADPRPIRFTPGKRVKAFEKNVVAIGLSGGFLEPLESTSIHLIQSAALRLLALFPAKGFNAVDIEEYNRQTDAEYHEIRDFIIAHYKVTDREDTPYWKYLKHMDVPETLQQRMELFKSSGRFFTRNHQELFREESWVQVLMGQGLPMAYDPVVEMIPEAQVRAYLRDLEEVIEDSANALPRHIEYIRDNCRAEGAVKPASRPQTFAPQTFAPQTFLSVKMTTKQ